MSKPPQKRVAESGVVPQGGFNLRNFGLATVPMSQCTSPASIEPRCLTLRRGIRRAVTGMRTHRHPKGSESTRRKGLGAAQSRIDVPASNE